MYSKITIPLDMGLYAGTSYGVVAVVGGGSDKPLSFHLWNFNSREWRKNKPGTGPGEPAPEVVVAEPQ